MFGSVTRAITFLARTPLVPAQTGPAAMELSTFSSASASAGPSRRPRAASRAISNMSIKSSYSYAPAATANGGMPMQIRGYASDKGQKELYSDEAGSAGAGTDDVAHSSAAFDKDPNPSSSAQKIENETGKDFTKRSPANPDQSKPVGKQGGENGVNPLNTSRHQEKH